MGPKDHPAGLLTLITVVKASAFIFHAYRCLRDNADDGRWRTMGDTASKERWFPTRQAPAPLEPVLGANLSTTTKHVSSREALCTPASSPRIPQRNTFYSSKSWSIHGVKCTSKCQTCRGRYEPPVEKCRSSSASGVIYRTASRQRRLFVEWYVSFPTSSQPCR